MAHHLTVEAQSRMEAAAEERRLELANLNHHNTLR